MAQRNINAEIQDRIAAFAEELSGLVREAAVEAVHEALAGGGSVKASRKPGRKTKVAAPARKAKAAKGGKRIRRSQADLDLLAGAVLAHVKANSGDRLEQIGVAINIATSELKRPIAQMMESGVLRTKGQRRGTMYFTKGRASAPVAKRKKKSKAS